MSKHSHNWMIEDHNRRWRDIDGKEFIMDTYVCECGAGGFVKTPKEMYDKGLKTLGITLEPTPTKVADSKGASNE